MIDELGVERAGERLWDQPWQDLFAVDWVVDAPRAGAAGSSRARPAP